ncbi:ABC transporter substrate-binding protein [Georgenia daeguensis]|uniref:ABC transporter substrate-binding protein n=2 Tax=Georgenia daeguensis TaxID=908355 RepID=A0ABP8EX30_9MICO
MRTRMCVTLTAAALLTLSACSGGGTTDDGAAPATGGATGGGGELTPITMGVLPIVPSAALQLGIDEGIFEDHGFDVTLETGQGGAALLPAVVSGQMQFAISNPLSIMLAQGEGLDVRLITGYSHSLKEGDDITSVWASADSGIASPKDLEGKTVAVNTLRTMGEVSIKKIVSDDGGDPNGVEFVELGFPDMPAALSAGNIDAAWVPEPFQTILKDGGNELISYNYQETMPGVPTMSVITAGTLAEQDPEMVDEFVAAVDEVTAFAQENPDKVRETLTTFLEMDDALAQKVLIEDFGAQMDEEAMQELADLSLEYGLVTEPVDMEKLMP